MRALMVTRVFLGAKGLRRCFASLPRARDARAHVRKFCSGRTVRAPAVASRHSFSRQSSHTIVGPARSAPSHRDEVGGCPEGDAVGAPGRAWDRVILEGHGGPRRPSVRRRSYGYPMSHGCAPWCARPGVEGYSVELRRRRGRCSGMSSGVREMGVGPPRSGRARLRAIHCRGGSGDAAVLLAQLMTYDGR